MPKGPNGGVTRRIAAPPVVDARNGVAQSRFSYNGGGSSSRIDARATDEEIEEAVERSLKHADDNGNAELGAMSGDRRDILTSAVVSAVAGRMSIRDACAEYDFNGKPPCLAWVYDRSPQPRRSTRTSRRPVSCSAVDVPRPTSSTAPKTRS